MAEDGAGVGAEGMGGLERSDSNYSGSRGLKRSTSFIRRGSGSNDEWCPPPARPRPARAWAQRERPGFRDLSPPGAPRARRGGTYSPTAQSRLLQRRSKTMCGGEGARLAVRAPPRGAALRAARRLTRVLGSRLPGRRLSRRSRRRRRRSRARA
jgi:hypothetical protein